MLVREDLGTELTVATRVLAHFGALAPEGRITLVTRDVLYVCGRAVANRAMTPYDVIPVLVREGLALRGEPPGDLERYLAAHRADPAAGSVAIAADGAVVTGPTLRACAAATLRRVRPSDASDDELWRDAASEARLRGALVGATP